MRNNEMVLRDWESKWLNPEYIFFEPQSTKVDYEMEKEEQYYGFSDSEWEQIQQECVRDGITIEEIDAYEWSEILEQFTGERVSTENLNVDVKTGEAYYYHR